jgi:hypothetical protein
MQSVAAELSGHIRKIPLLFREKSLKKSLFRFIAYYRFEDRWHSLLTG